MHDEDNFPLVGWFLKLMALCLYLLSLATIARAEPVRLAQAPRPPQAPPVREVVKKPACDCPETGGCSCDGECLCVARKKAAAPLKSPSPCSPACTCGCNSGEPCKCLRLVHPSRPLTRQPASGYTPPDNLWGDPFPWTHAPQSSFRPAFFSGSRGGC